MSVLGNFFIWVFFLSSQRSPPMPLFMWDIMLFHFPLVILHPWRELDSWYNYMLSQFPMRVTLDSPPPVPHWSPTPMPKSTELSQKQCDTFCRPINSQVLGGPFAMAVLLSRRGWRALEVSDSLQNLPNLWSLGLVSTACLVLFWFIK